jgi:acetyl/propionyl-CoA carboxylase alpha subunit
VQTALHRLHPGWGFLAENPLFAALCEQHGVTFIGPPAHVMHLMGKKTPAKRAMARPGCTLIPGSDGVLDATRPRASPSEIGYPVLLKAESGGGGRGMRIARSAGRGRRRSPRRRPRRGGLRRSPRLPRALSRAAATSRSRSWPTATAT